MQYCNIGLEDCNIAHHSCTGPKTVDKVYTILPNLGLVVRKFPNFQFNVVGFLGGVGAVGNVG